jgi:pimeloyl-ACP methyl ester carboxylesterase
LPASQNPEHVVLCRRELVWRQQLLELRKQEVRGALQTEICPPRGSLERRTRLQLAADLVCHGSQTTPPERVRGSDAHPGSSDAQQRATLRHMEQAPARVQVLSADGTPIGVMWSGSGPPLVLVHGTAADHTRWRRVAPLLERHFTVFAMDRRGRGSSGDAAHYAILREAEDVAAVVDHVGSAVNLLGHSYGAICALEGALRTDNLRRLVLYEPPIPTGSEIVPPGVRGRIEELVANGKREEALLVFFGEVVRLPESQLDLMRAQPSWAARVAAAHTVSREANVEAGYRADFDRIRMLNVPTLLLLGGDSPRFFRDATARLHEALPDSRVHEMPGQRHVAMDAIPEQFAEAICSFLLSGS